jgi:membrane associated rhomboid family serine protease
MGLFIRDQDRFRHENYRFNKPSMFGGFAFFPPVIKYLLISNVIIFLFQFLFLGTFKIKGFQLGPWFMNTFSLMPLGHGFMPWQLFSYMFMHAGFLHLFFNMFALWMFGMELENLWGSKKFILYYLMCGVGAGLANLLIAPLFTHAGPTIGASGSVYGILVAFGMMFPERKILIYFLFPIKAKYFVLLYMVIEMISVGNTDGIAHFAHLGGALVGFIYILASNSPVIRELFNFKNHSKEETEWKPRNVQRNSYYEKYNKMYDVNNENEKEDDISQEKVDEILDKIGKEGYANLTEEEKKILFDASKKIH